MRNVEEAYISHFNGWTLGHACAFPSLADAVGQVGYVVFKTTDPVLIQVYFESKGTAPFTFSTIVMMRGKRARTR